MKLTRRALVNEIRTLTAQLDQARTEVNALQADKYELEERLLGAACDLAKARRDRDRAMTANVRLAHDLEALEAETWHVGEHQREEIRRFMARHPDLFGPEEDVA